ncbi:GMP synthase (glutamine-hydrolysing) [Dethiosulfatibacter aminovorans DSM 17477]|uniref:Glutamine amidotransferase n=1 Tax=Dethiosulfatibacter aminovorans DSM 17477 TaxID=1121476 RepID=A0A1M6JVU1_9FIRM|nr:gamma-glutamyl-gamma-aminobutyrate hydrolase family protein [Dethiosulfatibacter aminovorans]SHJ50762.1 GMP synthase (glutamine-hydrolysing) [Dethiosulfatibacter aminovorans DSM 17477]
MLIIIDNQSSYIKTFKRNFLAEEDFDYIFFDHNQPIILSSKAKVHGIILSGGRGTPYEPLNLTADLVSLMNFDVPVLGICLGFEILAVAYRGRIKRMADPVNKKEKVRILDTADPIFDGLRTSEIYLKEKHTHYISELPPNFINLGESDSCKYEIARHADKPIYGFQGHPEVSGQDGIRIMRNFISICGL